jgi:hypothetical protein
MVQDLVTWVKPRLSARVRRWDKAGQYVYGHLCLGKMLFPGDEEDPLFTERYYVDEQMIEQIGGENYHEFRRNIVAKIGILQSREFDHDATWELSTEGLRDNCTRVLQRLQNELCVQKGYRRAPLGEFPSEYVRQNMIGVVLRGRCIGAFDNNLHGSVQKHWQRILSPLGEFYECFASPFNHKFDRYYSMFEEDRAFGSLGNFFTMVHRNNGILPHGNYQMNPVFMNVMFEKVAEILANSVRHQSRLFCIVVTANWTDAPFYGQLTRLLDAPSYSEHSSVVTDSVEFVQDLSDLQFATKSAFWVFSMRQLPPRLMEELLWQKKLTR